MPSRKREVLPPEELQRLLEEVGALRHGHFILSSGLHSPVYVQCALLLQDPATAERVGRCLARRLLALRPESVLSPALGGLIVGHEVASALGVPFRFTEREGGEMKLRRSFRLRPGERVAIVEDVLTTGKSTREVVEVARAAGAKVVAVASIIDRSAGGSSPFEVPFFSLLRLDAPVYDPASGDPEPTWGPPEKPGSRPAAGG